MTNEKIAEELKHCQDIHKLWRESQMSWNSKLEVKTSDLRKRVENLERKLMFISGLASGGGAILGALAGRIIEALSKVGGLLLVVSIFPGCAGLREYLSSGGGAEQIAQGGKKTFESLLTGDVLGAILATIGTIGATGAGYWGWKARKKRKMNNGG